MKLSRATPFRGDSALVTLPSQLIAETPVSEVYTLSEQDKQGSIEDTVEYATA
jgi:hypothetical protein